MHEINEQRMERLMDSLEDEVRQMRHSFATYRRDPRKYAPQLRNLGDSAAATARIARVILRTLDEE